MARRYKSWIKNADGNVFDSTGDSTKREFYRDTVMHHNFNEEFGSSLYIVPLLQEAAGTIEWTYTKDSDKVENLSVFPDDDLLIADANYCNRMSPDKVYLWQDKDLIQSTPVHCDVDRDGYIVTVNGIEDIVKSTSDGTTTVWHTINPAGTGAEMVCFDNNGDVYVGYPESYVEKLSGTDGTSLSTVNITLGSYLWDATCDKDNVVWIAEFGDDECNGYKDGSLVYSTTVPQPVGVCSDDNGNIYIARYDGYLEKRGGWSTYVTDGNVFGVDCDRNGNCYVGFHIYDDADSTDYAYVTKVDKDGDVKWTVDKFAAKMDCHVYIAVTYTGFLYAAANLTIIKII